MGRVIRDYMTPAPHGIALDRPISEAHRLMREYRIRHLPVLDGGRLVGMVSERDLHLLETLKDVNPDEATVEEAMTPDPFIVPPDTPLLDAVVTMAERKLGSAVVAEGTQLVGVFTTTDALAVLADLLARGHHAGTRRAKH